MVPNSPERRSQGRPGGSRNWIQYLSVSAILLSLFSSGCSSALPGSGASATAGPLAASPSAVSFGGATPIGKALSSTVTLTNRSAATLSIQSVKVSSPAFSVQGWTGPVTLAPGHSTPVILLFTPPSKGTYSGTLSIGSEVKLPTTGPPTISSENGVLTTSTVSLSGEGAAAAPGTPQISITPGSIQLKSGQSEQYAASVTGMTNPAVTWSAALGVISYGGLYTAPPVKSATADTITATSVSSPSTHTTASVTIQPPPPGAPPAPTPPTAPTPPAAPTAPTPTPTPAPAPTTPVVGGSYISPDGSDSNPGTEAKPWLTFAHAIPLLVPGSALYLENGTYTGSNSGYPNINCNGTAHNGTSGAPITIQAVSERQAWIDSDGSAVPFNMQNCSHWTIQGLQVSDSNNASLSESYTFGVVNSSHINVIRNLVHHTNQLVNEHAIGLQGTCNSLVQDNEVYYYHRHAFIDYQNGCTSGNGNEWQQNYANARGWGSGSTVGNGNGFMQYGAQYGLEENNISENDALGAAMDTEAITGSNNVAYASFLGMISLDDRQGIAGTPHQSGTCPNNLTYVNDVVITPLEIGWEARGVQSTTFSNISLFQSSTGTVNYFQDSANFSGCTPSVAITNSNILNGGSVTGYNNALDGSCTPSSCTLGTLTLNYGGSYSANAKVTNQFSSNPALGACYLWVPASSPAKGAGLAGADIGANVLYAYSGGTLTSTPLWNSSGELASAGALVTGLNDQPGESLFDFGTRAKVNQGGCAFPPGYLGSSSLSGPSLFVISLLEHF